jgi:hypothetical protein
MADASHRLGSHRQMTVAAYARHRGCSRRAVYAALAGHRIHRGPDGRIDSEVADREWTANTSPVAGGRRCAGEIVDADTLRRAEGNVRRLLRLADGEVVSFAEARRVSELLKGERLAFDLAVRRGQYEEVAKMVRTVEVFEGQKKAILLDVPASEADALTEAMLQDCTVGTAKRELERIVRHILTRCSETAFAMAAAQPAAETGAER